MIIKLRYFTGTGNSLKILDICREYFIQSNHTASISEINSHESSNLGSDILGFCFPVYAFGIPRICRNYLQSLQPFTTKQKVFILITAGDSDEAGYSVQECVQILQKKNCEIIYSEVIQMPINWTTAPIPPFPPTKEEALEIIKSGVEQAKMSAHNIINGIHQFHSFNYPKRYSKIRFYKDYYLFKYMGLQNLWRAFKVYDTCNGCKICEKVCPTKSITCTNKIPVWSNTCEQCMRCVNFCPQQAIYQSYGGDTKGKNRYYEPSFKPLL
jgi:ferredoxin